MTFAYFAKSKKVVSSTFLCTSSKSPPPRVHISQLKLFPIENVS